MSDERIQFVGLVDAMLERRPIPEMKPEPIIEDAEEQTQAPLEVPKKAQPQRAAGEVDAQPSPRESSESGQKRRRNHRSRRGGDKSRGASTSDRAKKTRDGDSNRGASKQNSGTQRNAQRSAEGDGDKPNRRRRRRRRGGGQGGQPKSQPGPSKKSSPGRPSSE